MDRVFSAYSVEEGDTIDVEIGVENLLKTLRSINSSEVNIRLKSTKSRACHFRLTSMQKFESAYYPVSHEIPVQITHRRYHSESPIIDSVLLNVSEIMPTLLKLSERYRFLDNLITIEGNKSGVFRIRSQSILGNVISTWTNVPKISLGDNITDNPSHKTLDKFSSVTIRARDWWNILQVNHFARTVVICISDQISLHLYCFLDPNMNIKEGTFSYYVSHVSEE